MKHLSTVPEAVRIYRSSAEVIRTVSVQDLPGGTVPVVLNGVSSGADLNSVRLFTSESFVCTRFRFLSDREAEDMRKDSQTLQDQIDLLKEEISIRNTQIELLKTNGDFTGRKESDSAQMLSYIESLPEKILALLQKNREAEKEIRELEKKKKITDTQESSPLLYAELCSESGGTCGIQLRYIEPNAGWRPFYEIHTDAKEALELRMRAEIRQTTGEDWQDVSVSLYTGSPSLDGQLPEMPSVYLDLVEPAAPHAKNMPFMAKAMGNAMMMDSAMAGAAPMMRAATPEAQVSEEETMSEYTLPQKQQIPSDPQGILADLEHFTIPAEYRSASCARKDPSAYLTAILHTSDLPPRSISNARVYLKDIYTGDTDLDPDFSEDTVTLSLGKEERIHVSFHETKKKTSNVLLKGQKVTEYEYTTTVTNSSSQEVCLMLKDRIPVSRDKAITVEMVSADGAEKEENTGILTKEMRLSPKESGVWKLSYKVFYPKDRKIRESEAASHPKYCPECGAVLNSRTCSSCGYRIS